MLDLVSNIQGYGVVVFDVIVIGAGAAGLMSALRAGQRGKRVLVLDHAATVGAKILISGGGRCNFTNRDARAEAYISTNPHFCRSALAGYTQHDFITLVEKHKIAYHEKTLGQLFCDGSAQAIVTMLLDECRAAGVEIRTHQIISAVRKADSFVVTANGAELCAAALVVASGGLSIPKMGATGFAYRCAEQFDVPVVDTSPALVPLTLSGDDLAMAQTLAGVALDSRASCGKVSFRENMVFTHRGLSGPAILQASSYWHAGQSLRLDLSPTSDVLSVLMDRKKSRPKAELKTIVAELMPQRLAAELAQRFFDNPVMGQCSDKRLAEVAALINEWEIMPSGSEGYAKAEVTRGGVDTRALSSKTMMVEKVPGLYFIGEAVDVTGWLGGYNFQWAWSSGWAAGSAV